MRANVKVHTVQVFLLIDLCNGFDPSQSQLVPKVGAQPATTIQTLLPAEGSSVISRQLHKAILEHIRRNVEQLATIIPLIPREDLCSSSAIFENHSRGTSQPRENSRINGTTIRRPDTSNTILKMSYPHLFHDSNRRCSKCTDRLLPRRTR
jgi:hypothetical protein